MIVNRPSSDESHPRRCTSLDQGESGLHPREAEGVLGFRVSGFRVRGLTVFGSFRVLNPEL